MPPRVTVITPTTGAPELARCVRSVQAQTIPVRHIVVADGEKFFQDACRNVAVGTTERKGSPSVTWVPDNTNSWSGGRWYGHRLYAFYSQLIDTDFIALLDQDNEYEPDHIEFLLAIALKEGFSWSYRSIWSNGCFIGNDVRESIGLAKFFNYRLIDTSAWMFSRTNLGLLLGINGQWGADRQLTEYVINAVGEVALERSCTKRHSLRYHVDPARIDFFSSVSNKIF
jgi:hypothetical protein